MNSWKSTLHIDEDSGLVSDVALEVFQAKAPVRIVFGEYADREELAPGEDVIVDELLQRLPGLENIVAEAAFKHYQMMRQVYESYEEKPEVPTATDVTDLQRFYFLQTIFLPEEPEAGRFGLGFSCRWEEEHGFGVQFRNWQLVEVGGEAEAFSFY